MALPPNFLDELRNRTPLAATVGRTVKLTRSGRDIKGCCPFHNEKTPSFYVYDDHFHCFGCGEHGDAITFVMKTTGAGFMEVVESLAAEAGLEVPKEGPREAEVAQKRANISQVLDAAATLYQKWLFEPEGRMALDYLQGRGLTDETIKRFGLGWSGEGRGALAAGLRGQGIKPDQLIEAGLMKQGDHGPVDMFFSRVMFPIRDRRGAMISFGGRIMGDGQPKYVNGPETAVFSKRRSLYGLNMAREAVRKGAALIVVEGYMDVIALSQAGFGGAVAPLGTALTEDHLAEIWRLTPEPVICFDGDTAGRRAALKTVDLALSALAPDRSLKFLHLPEKQDPDSIIRRDGAIAFTARMKSAIPISEALFGMLAEGASKQTPESRAIFYKRLEDAASRIPDKALAKEYRAVLVGRFFSEWRPSKNFKQTPKSVYDRSQHVAIRPEDANVRRGYVILSILINLPALFPSFEEALFKISFAPPCLEMFRHLQDFINMRKPLDNERFIAYLEGFGLEGKARQVVATAAADYRPANDISLSDASDAVWHFYYLMPETITLLKEQCEMQLKHFLDNPDDKASLARLIKYQELHLKARAGEFQEANEVSYAPLGTDDVKKARAN